MGTSGGSRRFLPLKTWRPQYSCSDKTSRTCPHLRPGALFSLMEDTPPPRMASKAPQPSRLSPRRRPPAACVATIATPLAVESAHVSEPGEFLFEGSEESPPSSPLQPHM
ncbi:hypothetical protein HPB47_002344 [Ixodes persulcatus]|uniref:Uncharacterized protein n=1 Tax=Ixodes persulcatus TaxID=34615 RepID=A0AC60PMQ8_IXOPE|nr:hypothetical protein HPB47_002344 [Ixodes persulcatus]